MQGFADAYETILRTVVDDLLATIAGIPKDELNTWLPSWASDDQPINTFAALAIHTAAAGEFMTTHAVGGAPSSRDREAEFRATGTHAEIRAAFATWLDHVHDLVSTLTADDLAAEPYAERFRERGWTRLDARDRAAPCDRPYRPAPRSSANPAPAVGCRTRDGVRGWANVM